MTAPRIVETLAKIERGPRSRIVVTLDEGPNGMRYVSIKRLGLLAGAGEVQESWREIRGVALQLEDLATVARALAAVGEAT